MNEWIDFLKPIIEDYKEGKKGKLTKHGSETLSKIINAKIDLEEGNIDLMTYDDIVSNLTKDGGIL